MDDAASSVQGIPVSSSFVVLGAILALSCLGAPWLTVADHRQHEKTTSLLNRWRLFSWGHPVQAAFVRWTAVIGLTVVVALSASSVICASCWGASLHDALDGVYRAVWKPA